MGYDCHSCGLPEAICICIDVDDEEGEDWSCAFPGRCLMAHTDHMRDECYTAEMYEEFVKEISQ
jgi:hypothetical protein